MDQDEELPEVQVPPAPAAEVPPTAPAEEPKQPDAAAASRPKASRPAPKNVMRVGKKPKRPRRKN